MKALPQGIGMAIRELDIALPGKHIKVIYNVDKKDAGILVQLRTGCTRLSQYLARIKAIKFPVC